MDLAMLTEGKSGMTPTSWGALSPGFDAKLRSMAGERRVQRGDILFPHGSPPDAFYCIEKGRLRVSVCGPSGREAVIGMYDAGQWFGEVSLFTGAPHLYDTRAIETTDVLVVSAAAFHRIVADHPDFLLELTRLISLRYRLALDWIDETILLPLPVRLARRLIAAAAIHGHPVRHRDPVSLRISQEDLSHMLGVSRQSVNRQLKEWEAKAILRLKYGAVTLLDQAALQDLV
jgi:CRP-like cAMP-binding protein